MYQGQIIKAKDIAALQQQLKTQAQAQTQNNEGQAPQPQASTHANAQVNQASAQVNQVNAQVNNVQNKISLTPAPHISDEAKAAQLTIDEAKEKAEQISQEIILKTEERCKSIIQKAKEQANMVALEKAIELQKQFQDELLQTETKLGLIVADSVRKIIGTMPKKNIERAIIKTALKEFSKQQNISIKVAPKSYNDAFWKNWTWAKNNNLDEAIFEKDDSLQEGQCIIEFAGHEIDVGIETQLTNLEKSATDAPASSNPIQDKTEISNENSKD